MPKHYALTCDQVKQILAKLGFEKRKPKGGGSHEYWVRNKNGDKFRKVTVDCPKAPFSQDLIGWMARDAGLSKKEFYAVIDPAFRKKRKRKG